MKFDYVAFLETLPVMLQGMLGIFIVTLLIIAVMYLLSKLTAGKTGEKQKQQ